jgi:hypothetical protein
MSSGWLLSVRIDKTQASFLAEEPWGDTPLAGVAAFDLVHYVCSRGHLVPRTRSSHHNCRESDCELRVQSGTRIIELLASFDSEVRTASRPKRVSSLFPANRRSLTGTFRGWSI